MADGLTFRHSGAARASAATRTAWPRPRRSSTQVGLRRLTSVPRGPTRANGSPVRALDDHGAPRGVAQQQPGEAPVEHGDGDAGERLQGEP